MQYNFQTSEESGERVGRTVERLAILADSRATNLVDQKMTCVSISRAKASAAVCTDDRVKPVSGIMERAGEKQMEHVVLPVVRLTSKSAGAGIG